MTKTPSRKTILITGAAGNLGGLLARHFLDPIRSDSPEILLRLMVHRTPLAKEISQAPNVEGVKADLNDPSTLVKAVEGADVVVHFAGVMETSSPAGQSPDFAPQNALSEVFVAADA